MKILVLLRHSEAEDGNFLADYDRKLTLSGIKKIELLASNILTQKFEPNYMLTSSAIRAYTTAEILAQYLNFQVDKIESRKDLYNQNAQTLMNAIENLPNETEKVIVVNHNPAISEFATWLNKDKNI